jgi:CheY-like chemotaxis protein
VGSTLKQLERDRDYSAGDESGKPFPKHRFLRSISFSFILAAIAVLSFFAFQRIEAANERTIAYSAAKRAAADLVESLASIVSQGGVLQHALTANTAISYDEIKTIAMSILASDTLIEGVSVAPGAIVKYHFPEKDNKIFIGHDLLTNPERRESLVEALAHKGPMVSGPFDSVDFGETGFVRYPIMSGTKTWGFVNLMFDFPKAMKTAQLDSRYPGLSFALAKETSLDNSSVSINSEKVTSLLVWGDKKAYSNFPILIKLDIPGDTWVLCVTPKNGWATTGIFAWLLFIEALMASVFLFFALNKGRSTRTSRKSQNMATEDNSKWRPVRMESMPVPEFDDFLETNASIDKDEPGIHSNKKENEGFDFTMMVGKARGHAVEFKGPVVQGEVYMPEKKTETANTEAKSSIRPEILVVDDGEASREILSRMLAARGLSADMASRGVEAIGLCSGKRYDLILMDCFMPEMDGYTTATRVREFYGAYRPPIVGMSARVDEKERDRCASAGMDDLLAKPFTLKELVAALKKYLPEDMWPEAFA